MGLAVSGNATETHAFLWAWSDLGESGTAGCLEDSQPRKGM
jgi:hypothetical protein